MTMAERQRATAPTAPSAETQAAVDGAVDRIFDQANLPPSRYGLEPKDFDAAWNLAGVVAAAGICGITLQETALVILQTGRELGLTAMQSLRAIYVIDGRPSLYADAMIAIVRTSGKCAKFHIKESSATKCVIVARRVGDEEDTTIEWTIDEANKIMMKTAGGEKPLTSKDVWQNYPRRMLRHRGTSEICQLLWSDVLLGLGTPEELETAMVDRIFAQANLPGARVDIAAPRAAVPTMPPSTSAPSTMPGSTPTAIGPSPAVVEWVKKFEGAKTQADLDKLTREVPKELRTPHVTAAKKAAAERIASATAPKDPPPSGGGAPKPDAPPAATEADPERDAIQNEGAGAGASAALTPEQRAFEKHLDAQEKTKKEPGPDLVGNADAWAAHIAASPNEHAVAASYAKRSGQFRRAGVVGARRDQVLAELKRRGIVDPEAFLTQKAA